MIKMGSIRASCLSLYLRKLANYFFDDLAETFGEVRTRVYGVRILSFVSNPNFTGYSLRTALL